MNWPNGLTLARLIMGPVILALLLIGEVVWAFSLFIIAMMTDLYDGYLARRSNNVTEFGKLMDPLADKVLVSLVLVGFLFVGLPPVQFWMVALIVGRELLILGWRTGVFKSGNGFVTSRIAKWKTAAQMTWIASCLLYLALKPQLWPMPDQGWPVAVDRLLWGLGVAAVTLTVVSGAEYVTGNSKSGG